MTPNWELLSHEAAIVAALVVGLAKRAGCEPGVVLDTIEELLEEPEERPRLRLVGDDPQAAA